jgi:hypothetical protein
MKEWCVPNPPSMANPFQTCVEDLDEKYRLVIGTLIASL